MLAHTSRSFVEHPAREQHAYPKTRFEHAQHGNRLLLLNYNRSATVIRIEKKKKLITFQCAVESFQRAWFCNLRFIGIVKVRFSFGRREKKKEKKDRRRFPPVRVSRAAPSPAFYCELSSLRFISRYPDQSYFISGNTFPTHVLFSAVDNLTNSYLTRLQILREKKSKISLTL